MSDILKVTSPPVKSDPLQKLQPGTAPDSKIPNIPDPTRITEANSQNVFSDRQSNKFSKDFESNYDKFLYLLRSLPNTGEFYKELFFTRTGALVNAGIDENFAQEISEYMELLKMTDSELLTFVKSQFSYSTKFSKPIFDIFREIYKTAKSDNLKTAILELLRKYDGLTASTHVLNEIISNLKGITRLMPNVTAQDMNEMISKLFVDDGNVDTLSSRTTMNLDILKKEIIPYLSRYIGVTHDFGPVRDFITMLTINLARYEYCSTESFINSYYNLLAFDEFTSRFTPEALDKLENLFISQEMYNSINRNDTNQLVDKLINIITAGTRSRIPQHQDVFENIMKSMLINESVYMPLVHIIVPADINGQLFFSEIWADPDAENSEAEKNGAKEPVAKLLIKFDIKNVGYFEIIILSKKTALDIQLFYPERLSPMESQIKTGISEIAKRNQLTLNSFTLDKLTAPKSISEVFPKIYERKNAINVIV